MELLTLVLEHAPLATVAQAIVAEHLLARRVGGPSHGDEDEQDNCGEGELGGEAADHSPASISASRAGVISVP